MFFIRHTDSSSEAKTVPTKDRSKEKNNGIEKSMAGTRTQENILYNECMYNVWEAAEKTFH